VGPEPLPEWEEPRVSNRHHCGRWLRVVTRAGASLGETLVDEGLADEKVYRGNWC
jgi:uncharacterized protein YjaZ